MSESFDMFLQFHQIANMLFKLILQKKLLEFEVFLIVHCDFSIEFSDGCIIQRPVYSLRYKTMLYCHFHHFPLMYIYQVLNYKKFLPF